MDITNATRVGNFFKDENGDMAVELWKVDYIKDKSEIWGFSFTQDLYLAVKYFLHHEHNLYRTELGIEGCVGQWYISSVDVAYHNKVWRYVMVEVTIALDV